MEGAIGCRATIEVNCRSDAAARKLLCNRRIDRESRNAMNWNQIEGRWDQLTGQVKSQWGKLTDDDLKNIAGKRQQLIGKLQERYGIMKDDIEKQVNHWLGSVEPEHSAEPETPAAKQP